MSFEKKNSEDTWLVIAPDSLINFRRIIQFFHRNKINKFLLSGDEWQIILLIIMW